MQYYDLRNKLVVVIDIFRASSAICSALNYGVEAVIPVKTVDEARRYKEKGYIAAAERKGEIVPGFDIGNSPFSFMDDKFLNQTIVLTTSNCTRAIWEAREKGAEEIVIGCFLNKSSLENFLVEQAKSVILLCAGWKYRFNLEDTLFAGSVVESLEGKIEIGSDSALAAKHLYQQAKGDLRGYLRHSSHTRRLQHLGIERDIEYSLQIDRAKVIPIFHNGRLVPLEVREISNSGQQPAGSFDNDK